MQENRYTVCKYGRWHFSILDHTIGLLLRCGPNAQYDKPLDDKNNKLLLFKKKVDAESYIKEYLEVDIKEDYGCDICGVRKDYDEEIIWLTSTYGVCEDCFNKLTNEDLDRIRNDYE
jgi:hypothetical protein